MITWRQVEDALHKLEDVQGGFTNAHRGIITINDTKYFVKIASDERTRDWIKREIAVYDFLKNIGFNKTPRLVAVNPSSSGICLEALSTQDSWDWSNNYSVERVESILNLIDELDQKGTKKAIGLPLFSNPSMNKHKLGWSNIFSDMKLKARIREKLEANQYHALSQLIDDERIFRDFEDFDFKLNTLVHLDIRGDNCAWNASRKQSLLVDWNWTDISDKSVDIAAFLTNVEVSGLSIIDNFSERLNPGAFLWLAGFWFEMMLNERNGKPQELLYHQMQSAVTAFGIYTSIR